MPDRYRCPECGAVYFEDTPCIACLCETLPDTRHRDPRATKELSREQRALESMMRNNGGVRDE